MARRHRLDRDKAMQVLLYVVSRVPNMYNALKVIYFADRQHLAQYGRFIYGDSYVAMKHGPVPSTAYDLLNNARGDGEWSCDPAIAEHVQEYFRGSDRDHTVTALQPPDLDFLSESDRECLDEAIEKYGHLSFAKLRHISHNDKAFRAADENDWMPPEAIARSLPNADELLEYLESV